MRRGLEVLPSIIPSSIHGSRKPMTASRAKLLQTRLLRNQAAPCPQSCRYYSRSHYCSRSRSRHSLDRNRHHRSSSSSRGSFYRLIKTRSLFSSREVRSQGEIRSQDQHRPSKAPNRRQGRHVKGWRGAHRSRLGSGGNLLRGPAVGAAAHHNLQTTVAARTPFPATATAMPSAIPFCLPAVASGRGASSPAGGRGGCPPPHPTPCRPPLAPLKG